MSPRVHPPACADPAAVWHKGHWQGACPSHEKIAGYSTEHAGQESWTQNASTSSAPPSKTWLSAPLSYGGIFDFDAKFERLRTVNASLEDPAVWKDPKKAQELGMDQKSLSSVVVTLD